MTKRRARRPTDRVLRSLVLQRYLLLRFLSALFSFVTMYWVIVLVLSHQPTAVIALVSFLGYLFSLGELYIETKGDGPVQIRWTSRIFIVNWIGCILLALISLINKDLFFPQMKLAAVFSFLILVFLLLSWGLWKIGKMKKGEDRAAVRIAQYKSLQKNKKGKIHV